MPGSESSGLPAPLGDRRLPSFQSRLTLSLLGVVLLLTGALLSAQIYSSARIIRSTVETITSAHLSHNQTLVAGYFDDAQRQLFAAEHWAEAGRLTVADTESMASLVMPLCDSTVQISGAYLSDCQGSSVTLRRSTTGWESIGVSPALPGSAVYSSWPEPHNRPSRSWRGDSPPAGAAGRLCSLLEEPETVRWTGLIEDGPGGPGVLVAKALRHVNPGKLVLMFEISLWDIDALLDQLHPTPHGFTVLVDADRGLLERNPPEGMPGLPDEIEEPEILEMKQRLLEIAQRQWTLPPGNGPGSQPPQITSFRCDGQRWWAATMPLDLRSTVWGSTSTVDVASSAGFNLMTFLPERDLLGELRSQRVLFFAVALVALLLTVLLGSYVARLYSAPLGALVRLSQRIQRLDLEPDPESTPRAAVAEIAQLGMAQERMRQALQSFSRYVPVKLLRQLLDREEAAQIGGRTTLLTILVTDIRGFVHLCEALPPGELTAQLEEYFECLLRVLDEGGATVDKFVGDSVVSFWGAPQADGLQAQHAVHTALRAGRALDALNAKWRAAGQRTFQTKMGIAQGEVVVGNVGASWRLNYTALGDAMNLASRLQQLNPRYGTQILVNSAVRMAAADGFVWRLLDRVESRGRRVREDIYEPLAEREAATHAVESFAAEYELALNCFWSGNIEQGQALLNRLLQQRPEDESLLRLQQHLRGWAD